MCVMFIRVEFDCCCVCVKREEEEEEKESLISMINYEFKIMMNIKKKKLLV